MADSILLSPKQRGFCLLKPLHRSKTFYQTLGQGAVQWRPMQFNCLDADGPTQMKPHHSCCISRSSKEENGFLRNPQELTGCPWRTFLEELMPKWLLDASVLYFWPFLCFIAAVSPRCLTTLLFGQGHSTLRPCLHGTPS